MANNDGDDASLHLPRILCLHGGGTNGEVFYLQSRSLRWQLRSSFRFVFADGPFMCEPHPAIIPIYKDCGPFRRWLPWLAEHQQVEAQTIVDEIDYHLKSTMDQDDRKGATGEWVGLMGFSQGAIVSASLLYRQQVREEKLGSANAGSNYRFAVLLAGRAPLVSLDRELITSKCVADPSQIGSRFSDWPDEWNFGSQDHMLRLPTLHVHGLQDEGLQWHRRLLDQYCEPGTTRLVTWDGDHRVPVKNPDANPVVKNILDLARETGVNV